MEQGFEDPDQCFDVVFEPNFSLPTCSSKFIDDRQDGGYKSDESNGIQIHDIALSRYDHLDVGQHRSRVVWPLVVSV